MPNLVMGSVYGQLSNINDLQQGDQIVLAIQNGRYSSACYALCYNPDATRNAVPIQLQNRAIMSTVTPDMLWEVVKTTDSFIFYNIYEGHAFYLMGNINGWQFTQQKQSARFVCSEYGDPNKFIMWRSDNLGSRFDIFHPVQDIVDGFDQIEKGLNLSTGANALTIFKLSNQVIIEDNNVGVPSMDVMYTNNQNQIILPQFSPYGHYDFFGWASTPTSKVADIGLPGQTITVNHDITIYAAYNTRNVYSQCFDYTQLQAKDVCTCRIGHHSVESYYLDNEWTEEGVIPNRHVVITTNGYDSLVPQLSLIPAGETSSIRIGDAINAAQKERISYVCEVDTAENAILTIKWACVMQDPHHNPEEQPRFELKIKDEHEQMIDSTCGYFNFSSGYDTQEWNISFLNFDRIWWKDWTTLSFDLSPYHGQFITIEITNYDCTEGGHFGYGYFNISCQKRAILNSSCSQTDSLVSLTAPAGFFYQWNRISDNKDFGNSQTINVPSNGDSYVCHVATKSDGDCAFRLEATPMIQNPIAAFDAQLKKGVCADTLILRNRSFVTTDGSTPVHNHTPENILWNFGRGAKDTSSVYNAPDTLIYRIPGLYHVSLFAGLENWACMSSEASFDFVVEANQPYQHLFDTICQGETFVFFEKSITLDSVGTYMYIDTIKNSDCLDEVIVEEHLFVAPSYLFVDKDSICWGEQYFWHNQELTTSGVYYDSLISSMGCDSVYVLTLYQYPQANNISHIKDTICYGDSYNWNSMVYNQPGNYTQHFTNQYGCDSTVILELLVRGRYGLVFDSIYRNVRLIDSLSLYWRDSLGRPTYWDDPFVINDTLFEYYRPWYWEDPYISRVYTHDTICKGQYYDWQGKQLHKTGIYFDTLSTIYGCDSIVFLDLFVKDCLCDTTYSFTDTIFIYDSLQVHPFMWFGKEYTEPGLYTDTLIGANHVGCDSIGSLLLRVLYKDILSVCGDNQVTFHTPWGDYTSIPDCDCLTGHPVVTKDNEWLVSISLCVHRLSPVQAQVHQQVKEEELPYTWNDFSLPIVPFNEKRDTTAVFTTPAASGCDSITTLFLHVLGPCELPSIYVPVWWKNKY